MPSVKLPHHCPHPSFEPPQRPRFNHQNTLDRLRESELRRPSMTSRIRKDRKSIFREVGLDSVGGDGTVRRDQITTRPAVSDTDEKRDLIDLASLDTRPAAGQGDTADLANEQRKGEPGPKSPSPQRESRDSQSEATSTPPQSPTIKTPWYAKLATGRKPRVVRTGGSSAPPSPVQGLSTMTMLALAVAVMAPLYGRGGQDAAGVVDAGPIARRADSQTNVCARWAQQSKITFFPLWVMCKGPRRREGIAWDHVFFCPTDTGLVFARC